MSRSTSKNRRKKRFAGRRQPNGMVPGSSSSSMNPVDGSIEGEQIGGSTPPDDEQADDNEVHGSAGFDDELHEQTGTSFVGGREDGEESGTEESRYGYDQNAGAGQSIDPPADHSSGGMGSNATTERDYDEDPEMGGH